MQITYNWHMYRDRYVWIEFTQTLSETNDHHRGNCFISYFMGFLSAGSSHMRPGNKPIYKTPLIPILNGLLHAPRDHYNVCLWDQLCGGGWQCHWLVIWVGMSGILWLTRPELGCRHIIVYCNRHLQHWSFPIFIAVLAAVLVVSHYR